MLSYKNKLVMLSGAKAESKHPSLIIVPARY